MKVYKKIILMSFIIPLCFLFIQFIVKDEINGVKDYVDNLYLQAIVLGYIFNVLILSIYLIIRYVFEDIFD